MKKKVPKLRQEVKVTVDIFTSDDIKMYYTGKFQDFTARYIIKESIARYCSLQVISYSYIELKNLFSNILVLIQLGDEMIYILISNSLCNIMIQHRYLVLSSHRDI